MPPRSKVVMLPPEVKAWLDAALISSSFSGYEQLAEALAERGFAISRSSLQRYGEGFEARLSTLKLATEQAKAISESLGDDQGAMNEAVMALCQERLFNLLIQVQTQDPGEVSLPAIARAAADLARASVTQKKYAQEVRKRAAEAAAAIEQECKREGVSDETIAAFKARVFGIAG